MLYLLCFILIFHFFWRGNEGVGVIFNRESFIEGKMIKCYCWMWNF